MLTTLGSCGLLVLLCAATASQASGAPGWAYLLLIALPLVGALACLLGALVIRDYSNPVHFAKADVNDRLLMNLPPHLSVHAARADLQPQ